MDTGPKCFFLIQSNEHCAWRHLDVKKELKAFYVPIKLYATFVLKTWKKRVCLLQHCYFKENKLVFNDGF